jgi:hypothetical protein
LLAVDLLFGFLPIGTSAKYIRPSLLALRQELMSRKLGVKKSSPRLAARDGMEQEPYEFWIRPMNPESKGKATYGAFREHAFPRFTKVLEKFFSAEAHRIARGPSLRREIATEFYQERTWVTKSRCP